jgi:Fe2+ transport system protein B
VGKESIYSSIDVILNKVLKGDCGHFITDIPPLRIPRMNNIFKKTLKI